MVDLNELGRQQLQRIAAAPPSFVKRAREVKSKRAKEVVDEIFAKGYCTTAYIESLGYNHPPRAARDVRENGIPLVTKRYQDPESGRRLAAYVFGDFNADSLASKANGRTQLSNELKQKLIDKYGSRCFIFLEDLPEKDLQVDHRIPYEIAGEQDTENIDNFMLVSASANRRKSWECEHCPNWNVKDPETCRAYFWAHPEEYAHVACRHSRVMTIELDDDDTIEAYDELTRERGHKWIVEYVTEQASDALRDVTGS